MKPRTDEKMKIKENYMGLDMVLLALGLVLAASYVGRWVLQV